MATEKRLLELRIQDLEHRLYGSSSEKLPIEDSQLALIDEVFDNPEPATTEDVVVAPDIEKRTAKKPVRKPLPEHLEVVEQRLEPEARKDLRNQRAPAMVERLDRRLLELNPARVGSPVLSKSPLGKAIRYTLGQWEALVRYLEDGRYEIDTYLVENAIRPSCVRKPNWLFIGHPDAGWRSAVIYSLLITTRRYWLDPTAWLADVLRRIPTCTQAHQPGFSLELEAEGGLPVEVDWEAVFFSCPSQIGNLYSLTPAWETWVSRADALHLKPGQTEDALSLLGHHQKSASDLRGDSHGVV